MQSSWLERLEWHMLETEWASSHSTMEYKHTHTHSQTSGQTVLVKAVGLNTIRKCQTFQTVPYLQNTHIHLNRFTAASASVLCSCNTIQGWTNSLHMKLRGEHKKQTLQHVKSTCSVMTWKKEVSAQPQFSLSLFYPSLLLLTPCNTQH